MSNLTNNTADLRDILAAVNALPDAGGGGIMPSGTIEITENGTYDVTNYESALVEVSTSGGSSEAEENLDAIINRTIVNIESDVTLVAYYAFRKCSKLKTAKFPKATTLQQSCLHDCAALTTVDLGAATSIAADSMKSDSVLVTLIIRTTSKVCTMANTNALSSTKIASGTGYIYVPRALVDSYKSASNWSTYANQIRAIEDYPSITGG